MPEMTFQAGKYFWYHLSTEGRGGPASELALRYLKAHGEKYSVDEIEAFVAAVQKRVDARVQWYQAVHDEINRAPIRQGHNPLAPKPKLSIVSALKKKAKR
uniref:Uncharacterized protein n=1 Tax=viral metagenome TaxID=1070528 RepID=A0A6M3L1E9_9ZZZZ